MPHVAPDHNEQQPYRSKRGNLDPTVDITLEQHSALEQRARATQRLAAIGEMTGGIVHDFRNLLAVIEIRSIGWQRTALNNREGCGPICERRGRKLIEA